MSHGMRGRLRRAAWLGLGLLACAGTVGCMGDKKSPLPTKTPGTGLPGTPMVNGAGTPSRPGQPGQPGQPNWMVNGQPANPNAGGMARPGGGMTPTGNQFGGPNPNNFGGTGTPAIPGNTGYGYGTQPGGGVQPAGYNQPAGGNPSYIPSVGPTSSVTPNTNSVAMAGPGAPAARGQGPDLTPMTDLGPIPPAQPTGTLPSVTPTSYSPVAPPSPSAPVAPPVPSRYATK